MCLVLMSRMTRRQNGPVILQEFFLMGRAICALTGCAARHENTKKCFFEATLSKKNPLWKFLLPTLFHFTIQKRDNTRGILDVTSDVVLSCCCCPSARADGKTVPTVPENMTAQELPESVALRCRDCYTTP